MARTRGGGLDNLPNRRREGNEEVAENTNVEDDIDAEGAQNNRDSDADQSDHDGEVPGAIGVDEDSEAEVFFSASNSEEEELQNDVVRDEDEFVVEEEEVDNEAFEEQIGANEREEGDYMLLVLRST